MEERERERNEAFLKLTCTSLRLMQKSGSEEHYGTVIHNKTSWRELRFGMDATINAVSKILVMEIRCVLAQQYHARFLPFSECVGLLIHLSML